MSVTGGADSFLDLNGLLISYAPPPGGTTPKALLHVPSSGSNQLAHLGLTHSTLVPGWALKPDGTPEPAYAGLPALLAEISGLQLVIQRSVVGAMWINVVATANLTDSIIDATDLSAVAYAATVDSGTSRPQPGGALTMNGCTVIGKMYASLLSLVSDSIVWAELSGADLAATPPLWKAPLWATRKQEGCVRFSYLPAGAVVPRQFKCVEMSPGAPQPLFYSLRYGDPAYSKISPLTDDLVRRGADDGGEMGAFHFVLAPLRETDLRVRMQEYLPVSLEFGVSYEN